MTSRRLVSLILLVIIVFVAGGVRADSPGVPVRLQADLLVKVAAYDKNLQRRANGKVKVAIVTRKGRAESVATAARMRAALGQIDRIAGLPHEEIDLEFTDAAALAAACRAQELSILHITTDLSDQLEAVRRALEGVSVLTFSGSPDDVAQGVVVGFDLQSGKPKLLVNLTQAKKQDVDFSSDLLKVATVIR